jgi:hypothetical protein
MENDITSEGERGLVNLSKANYRHPLKHYAEFYKTTPRTIGRWIGAGRQMNKQNHLHRDAVSNLPPLDSGPQMEGWWITHMNGLVPERLAELAHPISTNGSNGVEGGLEVDSLSGADLQEAVQDARRHRDAVSRRLKDAHRSANATLIARWSTAYERLSAAAMKCEEVALKDREFSKKFVLLSDVHEEVDRLLHNLKLFRQTMPRRIMEHLRDLALSPELAERLTKAIDIEREAEDGYLRDLNMEKIEPKEVERLGIEVGKQTEEITKS